MYGVSEGQKKETDKPNEDAFFIDEANEAAGVADGVTRSRLANGQYPDYGVVASGVFVKIAPRVIAQLTSNSIAGVEAIIKIFGAVNDKIRLVNQEYCVPQHLDYSSTDYLCTTGIILKIRENDRQGGAFAALGYIGDIIGLRLSKTESPFLITRDQLEACHAFAKAYFTGKTLTQEITPEEANRQRLVWQRKLVRNNREVRDPEGNLIGFGVLTGEEQALHFVEAMEMPIHHGDRFILASDAFDRLADPQKGPRRIGDFLKALEPCASLRPKEAAEHLVRAIREREEVLKARSDDATVVVIDIHANS